MIASPLAPRRLGTRFWAQVGLGVVLGIGTVTGLAVAIGTSGPTSAAALLATLAWVVAGIAVLAGIERGKHTLPTGPVDAASWARDVRELRASRLEIVTAFEIERRRIERDLHDGAQQHLVAANLKLGEAALCLESRGDKSGRRTALDLLGRAQDDADHALAALRATVTGIHPTVLADLGLEAAVRDLAARSGIDAAVRVPHSLPTLPEGVAAAGYFLVAEALTNVAKHAPGARVTVLLSADRSLHVSVVDDGPGGAVVETGHGLAGMTERLAAFGGTLTVTSPAGGPTTLAARVPMLLEDGEPGIVLAEEAR